MGKFQRDADRCPVQWNPEEWPWVTRCNQGTLHIGPRHVDHRKRTYNSTTGAMNTPPRPATQEATDDE